MWDNLGRIIGEMPHIMRLSNAEFHKRIKIIGDAPQNNGRSSILVSGHLGNFEIPAKLSLEQKLGLHLIYRKANNPFVDALIRHTREIEGHPLIPKGQAGMRQIVDLMANNQNIGMLIDQKMDNGIDTLFFGTSVQTTSLPAKLALKYKARIIFTFMPRTQGAYFEVHFKELVIDYDQDDELQITQRINDELEKWVTQYPSQWFWIHNRWKK
jgi:KDO2-lipid IV(A) lauroyltransferase